MGVVDGWVVWTVKWRVDVRWQVMGGRVLSKTECVNPAVQWHHLHQKPTSA